MKYGMNMLLWTTDVAETHFPLLEQIKGWGYDGVELPVFDMDAGVTLVLEYLNRFECYFLNCAADTARFVREVNHPNLKMMFDTFHANIEEKDIAEAIRVCADETVHVHISENDRATPGEGHLDWSTTFKTLKEVGYDGWMVVEAFGLALPDLAAATKIWRRDRLKTGGKDTQKIGGVFPIWPTPFWSLAARGILHRVRLQTQDTFRRPGQALRVAGHGQRLLADRSRSHSSYQSKCRRELKLDFFSARSRSICKKLYEAILTSRAPLLSEASR